MAGIRDKLDVGKAERMSKRVARDTTRGKEPDVVNPRTWNMFKEAVEFRASGLEPFQRELAAIEVATMDFVEGVLPLLRSPLPRVWETVEGGLAEPIRATVSHNHPHIAGGDMADGALRRAVEELEARMQLKVRKPLAQWDEALETVRGRFPELERLRTTLERRTARLKKEESKMARAERKSKGVRRRKGARVGARHGARAGGVSGLFFRCTHPLTSEDTGGVPSDLVPAGTRTGEEGEAYAEGGDYGGDDAEVSREFRAEDLGMKLKDKHRQLAAATDSFRAEEGLLYEQLSGLCRDAAWCKSYAASALLMIKELMQEGVYDLGACLQPLPSVRTHARAPAGEEDGASTTSSIAGDSTMPRLGTNDMYNAAMPEYATRGRARSTLEDLRAAASRRVHAHKATAQPLELHVVPEARGGERVAPARRAAAGVPLSSVPHGLAPSGGYPSGTPGAGAEFGAPEAVGMPPTSVGSVTPTARPPVAPLTPGTVARGGYA